MPSIWNYRESHERDESPESSPSSTPGKLSPRDLLPSTNGSEYFDAGSFIVAPDEPNGNSSAFSVGTANQSRPATAFTSSATNPRANSNRPGSRSLLNLNWTSSFAALKLEAKVSFDRRNENPLPHSKYADNLKKDASSLNNNRNPPPLSKYADNEQKETSSSNDNALRKTNTTAKQQLTETVSTFSSKLDYSLDDFDGLESPVDPYSPIFKKYSNDEEHRPQLSPVERTKSLMGYNTDAQLRDLEALRRSYNHTLGQQLGPSKAVNRTSSSAATKDLEGTILNNSKKASNFKTFSQFSGKSVQSSRLSQTLNRSDAKLKEPQGRLRSMSEKDETTELSDDWMLLNTPEHEDKSDTKASQDVQKPTSKGILDRDRGKKVSEEEDRILELLTKIICDRIQSKAEDDPEKDKDVLEKILGNFSMVLWLDSELGRGWVEQARDDREYLFGEVFPSALECAL